jgi:hypothetical protein
MDPPSQTLDQDPFLDESLRNSESQYESLSSSAFSPALDQSSTNEFGAESQHLPSATQVPFPVGTAHAVTTHVPQKHRMQQSQYYIIFSVTGIERSNVKNPIIRFDAKVTLASPYTYSGLLTVARRQTFLDSGHHLSVISEELTMS